MESIGGQAVIEGIMLRKKNKYSIAVRTPNGKIVVKQKNIKDYRKGFLSFFKLPFFRGMYSMYEMLSIGTKTLIYSNNLALEGEDEKITASELFWIITISLLFTIGFFVFLPYLLTVLAGFNEQTRPVLFNLVDAIIKLAFFIAYVAIIARMKDIKRVFEYHGAEHMVVHCYEGKKPLTVNNVKKYTPIHPRCGSSFVMITIAISIIVFSLLPLLIQLLTPGFFNLNFTLQKTILVLLRIVALPIIVAISYELLKLAGKYPKNILLRAVSYPGLLLQKMTTSRPDSKQIEVAIAAINKLI